MLNKFVDVKQVAEKLFKKQINDEKFKDTLAKIEETEENAGLSLTMHLIY